jgi:diaminohydroxyphosphoribosylaminopyrimidine deaminase / 5-amino-6-(5-phosphoribosylamino)uracil reductase
MSESKTLQEEIMKSVFNLAQNGEGYVEPNPMVGAIIIKDGQLLSCGYHRFFGSAHAEIEAITKVPTVKLKNSDLYINLEPCCHTNKKTPPCINTITKIRFKNIFIAIKDPNPKVSGKSIQLLKEKNYNVYFPILEQEAKFLNRAFFKTIKENIPYIVLKIAVSQNNIIGYQNFRKIIASRDAILYAKEERSKFNGILIGANTLRIDNPLLLPSNLKVGVPKKFYRIILSSKSIDNLLQKKIFKTASEDFPIIYATNHPATKEIPYTYFLTLNSSKNNDGQQSNLLALRYFLKNLLKEFNIGKLLVEGGSQIFRTFLYLDLADEIHLYLSKKTLPRPKAVFLFPNKTIKSEKEIKEEIASFNFFCFEEHKFSYTTLYKFIHKRYISE